jgi:hypothetical protein
MRSAAWLLMVPLFQGCLVGSDDRRPDIGVPADWRTGPAQQRSMADLAWWEV